ncbi:MAG: hypothetical protein II786_00570 [Muribaculaceae bacterium]|nr:hypothetical protein [Muribaculaceae bacterium]
MKRTLTITIAMLFAVTSFAQGVDDACLYSQTYYQGTAKSLGMGNALGAVGGDMTAININPAGMGIYRSNELTMSFNLQDNYLSSNYYGNAGSGNRFRVSIPNIGWVGTRERSNYRALRFTQFGIGLTRTNDFNMESFAKGINPTSSKIDNYLARIYGYSPNELQDCFPYDIYPAWRTGLIGFYQDEERQYYGSPVPQGNIWQSQRNNFKGRSEEWTFAGSANYYDRLFVGISINLAHVKRVGTKEFEESRVEGTETDFSQWSFTESLNSVGWGGNAKVGLIYHANPWLRLGAAFHSPTVFSFNESWQTETESLIKSMTQISLSPESHYEYTFIKPLRWIGSVAFVIGDQGMVSLDAEYTNYGAARFLANDYDYDATNEAIKSTFARTCNLRIGTEWRVNDSYLRFGVGYYGSPFGFGEVGGSVKKASCGISVPVGGSTTFDFAYELTHGKTYTTLYDAGELGIESIEQKQFKHLLLTTLKVRF